MAQTDTTAGFLSKNLQELNQVKKRDLNQPCLITTSKFSTLLTLARVPSKFKNLVRRSKKSTFLYPNLKAIRVVKYHPHSIFLDKHGWLFSTSANLHKEKFDKERAKKLADEVVDENFYEDLPSNIYKISRIRVLKVR